MSSCSSASRTTRSRLGSATRLVVSLAAASAVLAISACGSGSSGGEAIGRGDGSLAITIDPKTTLEKAYAGVTFPLPTHGPPAQSGKTVWYLSCLSYSACRVQVDGFEEAAKTLGWRVNALDNKADPNVATNQIRQAIAAKADAIVLNSLDCSKIKTGLDAAKAANIPVLGVTATDCDDPLLGSASGAEPGYTAVQKLSGTDTILEYYQLIGATNADVLVAAAAEDGIKSPRIMRLALSDILYEKIRGEAFDKRVQEICPSCTIIPIDFTLQQMVQQGQQVFRTAFLQNPTANVVYFPFDAVLPAGLQTTLSGAPNVKLACCGDGQSGSIDFARSAGAHVIVNASPDKFLGYAQADMVNRLLAGEKRADLPNEGGYLRYVDKTHNMPPVDGDGPPPPFDYVSAYQALWRAA